MMKFFGIKYNMKIYLMLFNGFVRLKDWVNVFVIFEDVIRDGLRLDIVFYNNIIRVFFGMGNMDRVIRMVE